MTPRDDDAPMAIAELAHLLRVHATHLREVFLAAQAETGQDWTRQLSMCDRMEAISDRLARLGPAPLTQAERKQLKDWQAGMRRGVSDEEGSFLTSDRRALHERMRRMVDLIDPLVDGLPR